jgi:hypothetical protein
MIEDAIYHLTQKTGIKHCDLMKMSTSEVLEMMARLIEWEM